MRLKEYVARVYWRIELMNLRAKRKAERRLDKMEEETKREIESYLEDELGVEDGFFQKHR